MLSLYTTEGIFALTMTRVSISALTFISFFQNTIRIVDLLNALFRRFAPLVGVGMILLYKLPVDALNLMKGRWPLKLQDQKRTMFGALRQEKARVRIRVIRRPRFRLRLPGTKKT